MTVEYVPTATSNRTGHFCSKSPRALFWLSPTTLTSVLLYLGSLFEGPRGPCAAVSGAFAHAELLQLAQAAVVPSSGVLLGTPCCSCTFADLFSCPGLEITREGASRVCLYGHMPNRLPSYTLGVGLLSSPGAVVSTPMHGKGSRAHTLHSTWW